MSVLRFSTSLLISLLTYLPSYLPTGVATYLLLVIVGTLTMKIGDVLAVDLDNRNGFKTETHMRLKNRVSYPCYKTEERMNIVKYPTYPEVPLHVCC